jgi:hypothetical protein
MKPEELRLLCMLQEFLEATKFCAVWNGEVIEVREKVIEPNPNQVVLFDERGY